MKKFINIKTKYGDGYIFNNWKVIPEDYLKAGRERDYKLLYPDK